MLRILPVCFISAVECNFEQTSQSEVEDDIVVEACLVCNGNALAQNIVLNIQSTQGSATGKKRLSTTHNNVLLHFSTLSFL